MAAPSYASGFVESAPESTTGSFLEFLNGSGAPPMESLSPEEARRVLEKAQSGRVKLAPAEVAEKTITANGSNLRLVIVRPEGASGLAPGFMFFHGGGWVLGDFPTHERFIRDLVSYSGAAAVYVDYDRSPEARYPTAVNQAYAATQWVAEHGGEIGVDGMRLGVAGNSAGGNLAAVTALRSKLEGGPPLRVQTLFWPVTDASFDTGSYMHFQNGWFLTRNMMRWFWDCYCPDEARRNDVFASPLRAEQPLLKGLPPALIQTAELDVLRDEGEAYARKLDAAGVDVIALRVNGMIHDYGLLNPLSRVPAVQAALRQAGAELGRRLQ
jgi:acetyl esterase/lipase